MKGSSAPSAPPARPRPVGSLRSADLELQDINKRKKAELDAVRSAALGRIGKGMSPLDSGAKIGTTGLSFRGAGMGPSRNLLADPNKLTTRQAAGIAEAGAVGIAGAQFGMDLGAIRNRMGSSPGAMTRRLDQAENFEAGRAKQLEEFIGKEMEALDKLRVGRGRGRSDNIRTKFNRKGFTGTLIGGAAKDLI